MPVLKDYYIKEVIPKMQKQFNYKNVMQVPKVEKVVINMGVGEAIQDPKFLDNAQQELSIIAGQKAVITRAKKSISNFKLRQGTPIGCKVTLRGDSMYEFLYKFLKVSIARIRDFKGFSDKSFDGRGNYSLGIKEQLIFPEIEYDKIDKIRGMDITIVTTAKTDEEAKALLSYLGLPFKRR